MRTKTLIAAAAILAVSLATTVAQTNVYSQNVVGYINLNLTNTLTLIANQLAIDATGTNNTVLNTLASNVPVGTFVYAYDSGSFVSATFGTKGWSGITPAVNRAMNPGSGFFIRLPAGMATNLTLVGEVRQGVLQIPYIAGFNLLSSIVPQGGRLQADLGYAPVAGDLVYRFNPVTQSYVTYSYGTKGWSPSDPTLGVGESFWLKAVSAGTWTRNFTVQ